MNSKMVKEGEKEKSSIPAFILKSPSGKDVLLNWVRLCNWFGIVSQCTSSRPAGRWLPRAQLWKTLKRRKKRVRTRSQTRVFFFVYFQYSQTRKAEPQSSSSCLSARWRVGGGGEDRKGRQTAPVSWRIGAYGLLRSEGQNVDQIFMRTF